MEKEEEVGPPPPPAALTEGWSREHHLMGHTTSISFLRPDENSQYYYPTEEMVQVAAFQTENPTLRQPALWRNLLAAAGTDKTLAVDYVAADTQDGSTKNFMQIANVQLVQQRMETVILERIYKKILPDLVLVAALEEVRSQFLKATDRHLQKGPTSKDHNTGISTKESPPAYYGAHPNQYMRPPVQTTTSTTKEAAQDEGPPSSSSFSFTPNQLVTRIKAGCQLAYSRIEAFRPNVDNTKTGGDRRASSRLARLAEQQQDDGPEQDDEEIYNYWKVTTGGNVATFIMEHYVNRKREKRETFNELEEEHGMEVEEDDDHDEEAEEDFDDSDNPYICATDEDITEWLGRKTAKLVSSSDLQTSFPPLLFQTAKKVKKKVNAVEPGRSALEVMSPTDQTIWLEAMKLSTPISENARLCIESLTYDDTTEVEKWETAQFGKSSFALRLVDQNEKEDKPPPAHDADAEIVRYKDDKSWSTWRYRGIHGGYTVWPSWRTAVEKWRSSQTSNFVVESSQENGEANSSDGDIARAIAKEEETTQSSGRRTRRGGETGTVFYGNQSTMTLKQMMDAMLRITSLRPFATMLDLLAAIPDDSTDPIRRMRNALGRIVYKRNQLARLEVTTQKTDAHCLQQLCSSDGFQTQLSSEEEKISNGNTVYNDNDIARLGKYTKDLLVVELWLRRLVVDHLTHIPVGIIATAADERTGMIESIDDIDFENPDELEWLASGHELLGKLIFRPVETRPVETPSQCFWFRIEEYVPSIEAPTEPGSSTADKPSLGRAKDTVSVERRIRFKALRLIPPGRPSATLAPNEDPLILTEGQVRAGIKAAELQDDEKEETLAGDENPMRGRSGAKVSLVPIGAEGKPKTGVVAGHTTCSSSEGTPEHKMLVMLESNPEGQESVWFVLEGDRDGLHCSAAGEESVLYSVQEFDYDKSSQAFKECKGIIAQLERHPKIAPFVEPVDPIALNIPTYFQVIKRPMDIATLSKKLENGEYSRFSLSETIGSTPVARMLNGPFRRDLELIFNNAILFNPSDDWIHKAAITMKTLAIKKIEQACQKFEELEFSRHRIRKSVYIEYDSDTDMYGYDDDKDEDYDGSSSNRKRKRTMRTPTKEDPCVKAIERGIPLQKLLPDGTSLRGPFGNFPVNSDASTFALPSDWTCHHTAPTEASKPFSDKPISDEIGELIELRSHIEDQNSAHLRRSTRAATHETPTGKLSLSPHMKDIAYECDLLHVIECPPPTNRIEVEVVRELLHENYYAKVHKAAGQHIRLGSILSPDEENSVGLGSFSEGSFPPFLGSFFPTCEGSGSWEIRSPFIVPALRWVIRGLVESEHLGSVEALTGDNLKSGVVVANNVYYHDETLTPLDVVDQKEFSRRKKAQQGDEANDSDEDDGLEMSEYEKMRQDRVARNAERLKALGLA